MYSKHSHIRTQLLLLLTVSFPFIAVSAKAANLSTETAKAWDAYVKMTEQRIKAEQSSEKKFLAFDFQDPPIAVRDRTVLFSGEILIKKIAPVRNIPVPDGMIHHWRGSIFIPAVSLDFVLDRVENPHTEDIKQEDVLAYNVLERKPGQLKIYLKLQRKKIVTAIYNTEHRVRYQRLGNGRAVSSSVATRIVEVERLPNNKEREKPEGSGRGFLWRMNSYWRYQQVEGGVIAECESLTLSRSIPFPLEYVVRPLINSVARESMARTLESLRVRMVQAYKLNHHNLES